MPATTVTVLGFVPTVCVRPAGKLLTTMSTVAVPTGKPSAVYVPLALVATVCTVAPLVTVTCTPLRPSPASLTPLPFKSLKTSPVTSPSVAAPIVIERVAALETLPLESLTVYWIGVTEPVAPAFGSKVTVPSPLAVYLPSGTLRILSSPGVLGSRSMLEGMTVSGPVALSSAVTGKVTAVLIGVVAVLLVATGAGRR